MRPLCHCTLTAVILSIVLPGTHGVCAADEDFPAPTIPSADTNPGSPGQVPPVPLPERNAVVPETAIVVDTDFPPMEIISLQASGAMLSRPSAPGPDSAKSPASGIEHYRSVYRSIPFSRAEYSANQNYRHDSTMEILTGNPRTTTVVSHNHEHRQPDAVRPQPARPSRLLTPFSGLSFFWRAPFFFYPWF